MANATVNRQVNVYINSGEAAKAYDVLIKREKLLNEELKKTADPRRIQQLNKELDKLKEPIDRATKKMKGEMLPSIRDLEIGYRKFLAEFKKTGSPESLAQFQKFKAELTSARAQLNGLENSSKSLTSKGIFSGAFWGSFLAGGVTAALSGLGNLFRGAVQEAIDADAATRRLHATLDNLGKGDAFDRISRKADELAAKFRYLDNDDIVGVFNKLIDYGKLTEMEMNRLLPVIIDFAAKSQVSIDESADVIIKALEGNAKALKQYGIDIKDAGSETERLNVIMTTLKQKVDGSAEAFQNSAKGGIAVARQEFANLKEEIGNNLLPVLNKALSMINRVVKGLLDLPKDIADGFKKGRGMFTFKSTGRIIDDIIQSELPDAILKQWQALNTEVTDVINASLSNKPLGIPGSNSGTSGNSGNSSPVKKIKEEVDLLAEALKKMYKVQEMGEKGARDDARENQKLFAELDKLMKDKLDVINGTLGNDPAVGIQRFAANRLAGMELQVLQSRGKKRLQAELALLKEQERQELENKTLTENQKLLIEEQYRQKRKQAETEYLQATVQNYINYFSTAIGLLTLFGQMQTDKENAALERDRRINDRKQANLERRLKKGLITELQYRQEVDKLEAAQEKKEKAIRLRQFQRDKRERLAQAIMNVAEGVAEALPDPFRIALAAAVGAVQIATIAAQKPPEFAQGSGPLGGRSHASGGNAVVDGSGRKIAEVEAGESIVNKRTMADRGHYSVSGTPSQIISRLNSMHGIAWESGATLVPGWRSYRPQQMNYAAMKEVYAAGGKFEAAQPQINAPQDAIFENFLAALSDMQATNQYLAGILAKGIKADVSLLRLEEQQDRLDAIRQDATMVG